MSEKNNILNENPQPSEETMGGFGIDGLGTLTKTLSMSGGTKTGPGFSDTYFIDVPAGNIYSISASADDDVVVSGGGISVHSYWDATQKKIISDSKTSPKIIFPAGAPDVRFTVTYLNKGGPYVLNVSVSSTRTEKIVPKDPNGDNTLPCKTCPCGNASATKNGSIDFSQPFGKMPLCDEIPIGKLVLKQDELSEKTFTPAALQFEHFSTRKVLQKDFSAQSATISAGGVWENVYENGVPAESESWKNGRVEILEDGRVKEILSDKTEINYAANGEFVSMKTARGQIFSATQLGVEVLRGGNGALRQIWSLTEGLLDIVATGTQTYEIRWYKNGDFSEKNESGFYVPAGTPIKIFTCGAVAENPNAFSLVERRGSLEFPNLWIYDEANRAWTFSRGNAFSSVRSWSKLEGDNDKYEIVETKTAGENLETFSEELRSVNGFQTTGKTAGTTQEYSATRVPAGTNGVGKIASETDRAGTQTSYEYDSEGRVIREQKSFGFAGEIEEKIYSYSAGTPIDFRPIQIVHKLAETILKTENFTYSPTLETHEIIAAGTTLREETHFYENGKMRYKINFDGTAELHEFENFSVPASVDFSSDLSYNETITRGVWSNRNFEILPAKSTRTKKFFDTRGNEIRTENFVHTGTDFELISWENRTFSPAHKIVSTEKSNGKTSSADFICTGPIWTIDENGVRTDFTYNSAKQCASETRHGVRGDVVKNFTYDASGRVIGETKSAGTLAAGTQKVFNADGTLAREVDELGNATTYVYSADGLIETKTFPNGATEITTKNKNGDLVSIAGTAVVAQFYSYEFNAENALKITTIATGTEDSARVEKTFEDALGRVVKREFAGVVEENFYSGTRLIRTTKTDFPQIDYAHDSLGNVIETTQTTGTEWRKTATETVFEKDAAGTIWHKTTQTISCSDASAPAQTTTRKSQLSGLSLACESREIALDARGNATETISSYDLATRTRTRATTFSHCTGTQISRAIDGVPVEQTLPGNITTSAVFDAFDRKISETDARGNVRTFTYDLKNRLISQTDASGATTTFEYDALDRETKRIFADATEIISDYDLRGNRISESGNATYRVEFDFDLFGQKTKMRTWRDAAGTPDETLWAYDEATGNLLSKTDARGNAMSYSYNSSGLLISRTWSRGVITTYAYDAWRQLISTTYSDGTPAIANVYNALGQLVSTSDAAGTRNFAYNDLGDLISENETVATTAFPREELYDNFGRSIGYILHRGTSGNAQIVGQTYDAASGKIATASFMHGNAKKEFAFNYLAGTDLLSQLVCPNNMTQNLTYEAMRDLIISMKFKRGTTDVVIRNYAYDRLSRPISRSTARQGSVQNDTFGYNSRSELVSGSLGGNAFNFEFDEIGNQAQFACNATNETTIEGDFVPAYDADGNATLVKTATGTWQISYNAENRPIRFECAGTQTLVEMNYDYLGRRFEKKITVAGTTTLHHRYVYRGFLQIACLDLTRAGTPALWFVFWDPTQSTATRPLAIQKNGTWFVYGHDLTKNVCEVFGQHGYIRESYSYSPFGNVSASGDVSQPFQWSSEFYDSELDLVYYNYRHYSPTLGRWLSRDPIAEQGGLNLYCFCGNNGILRFDLLGRISPRKALEILQLIEKAKKNCKKYQNVMDNLSTFENSFLEDNKNVLEEVLDFSSDVSGAIKNYLKTNKIITDTTVFFEDAFGKSNVNSQKLKELSGSLGKINNVVSKFNLASNAGGALSRKDGLEFFLAFTDAIPVMEIFSEFWLSSYKTALEMLDNIKYASEDTKRVLNLLLDACKNKEHCSATSWSNLLLKKIGK